MPNVRFVYFDLDDTLLDHRRAERRALEALCRDYAPEFGHLPLRTVQDSYHAHNAPLWRQYAAGDLSKDDLKRLRFERLLAALSIEGLEPEVLSDCYMDHYARHWHFAPDARDAFLAVAERYPVGVLTNGFASVQQAKLDRFPEIRQRLHTLVISEEVGVLKPHPQLFAHAAERAGTPPETLLYVGDSYHSDVQGALQAGWQMAWYTPETPDDDAPEAFRFTCWEALCSYLNV